MLLWQVAGPLSWLVSLVVSYVLLPAAYKREPEKVDVMLGWRPQVLHNGLSTDHFSSWHSGYVLFCVAEMIISRPPMIISLFPLMILFGLTYIAFAWILPLGSATEL